MHRRFWTAAILSVSAVATGSELLAAAQAPGVARANVCAGVGRRVSVGGCTHVGGAIARYAPPPSACAPLPEDYPLPPPPPP